MLFLLAVCIAISDTSIPMYLFFGNFFATLSKTQPLPEQNSKTVDDSFLSDKKSTAQSTKSSVSGRGIKIPGGVKNLFS